MAAGPAVAAFSPTDQRSEFHALFLQPRAFLAGRELDVRASPLLGPFVLRMLTVEPVPLGRALPVLPRQIEGILHPEPALHGGVHQEEPAEGPECLAAKVGCVLLVKDGHALAGPDQFVACHEPGQPAADDDDVCVHPAPPHCFARP